jgi:HSP20 family protein
MDLVKTGKDIANKVEDTIEKGIESAKDALSNVARHLPFANFAKHSNDTFDLEIDLPGVKKEDISREVEDNYLTITAVRNYKNEVKREDYYLCESSFGQIARSFVLPQNIDRDKIEAKYEDGRLYVTFEKEAAKKAKAIAVK